MVFKNNLVFFKATWSCRLRRNKLANSKPRRSQAVSESSVNCGTVSVNCGTVSRHCGTVALTASQSALMFNVLRVKLTAKASTTSDSPSQPKGTEQGTGRHSQSKQGAALSMRAPRRGICRVSASIPRSSTSSHP